MNYLEKKAAKFDSFDRKERDTKISFLAKVIDLNIYSSLTRGTEKPKYE